MEAIRDVSKDRCIDVLDGRDFTRLKRMILQPWYVARSPDRSNTLRPRGADSDVTAGQIHDRESIQRVLYFLRPQQPNQKRDGNEGSDSGPELPARFFRR